MLASSIDQAPRSDVPSTLGIAPQQYVTFHSAGGQYGAGIMQVQEIRSWQPTAPLPNRSHAARGVLDIRGKVVEVFDLSVMLGAALFTPDKESVILVLSLPTRIVGLLVESVSDIIQVDPGTSMPVPNDSDDPTTAFLGGMVNHEGTLIGLLDLDVLFSTN